MYHFTTGVGAADGTLCDFGKICKNMECVESDEANKSSPYGQISSECPFGDDIVINGQVIFDQKLPHEQMTCDEVIDYFNTLNIHAPAYCFQNPYFKSTCCQTCKSIK